MPEPDIESILLRYRPLGPDDTLRQKILAPASKRIRRWPLYTFRTAIAASLLFSFVLLRAAAILDRQAASQIGLTQWTPEAQQMADLIGPGGRSYIALCLAADAQTSRYSPVQIPATP